ncbi:MAG: DMT family transporter [Planctomycetota bacterium]
MQDKELTVVLGQIGLAVLCGCLTAYQPGINARFATHAGQAIHGGVLNFAIGLVLMILVSLVMRAGIPEFARLSQGPWWMWIGGAFGAFFVTLSLVLVPRMGATNFLAAMLAGQFVASAIIDHYGHMGLAIHEMTWGRAFGIVLILAGVACAKWL